MVPEALMELLHTPILKPTAATLYILLQHLRNRLSSDALEKDSSICCILVALCVILTKTHKNANTSKKYT